MQKFITIEVLIKASVEKVWEDFNNPEAIKAWGHASDDWHTTSAENDLKVGGKFSYRMEAKDGSIGFDFWGIYDEVVLNKSIAYTMGDGRKVEITFVIVNEGVRVIEKFEPETENPEEMQRAGWQAILDNFRSYVESN